MIRNRPTKRRFQVQEYRHERFGLFYLVRYMRDGWVCDAMLTADIVKQGRVDVIRHAMRKCRRDVLDVIAERRVA